ncbi:hypothetical protein BDV06DRAFT_133348, partial [Aspergillus oleicola]
FNIQLEEIRIWYEYEEREAQAQIGRDVEQAISTVGNEPTASLQSFNTWKSAQSIARTIDPDAQATTALTTGKTSAEANRRQAIQTRERTSQSENPSMTNRITGCNLLCRQLRRLNLLTGLLYNASTDMEDGAGLSTETKMGELCTACYDEFAPEKMKRLSCEHRYCNGCLKTLFKVATEDKDFVQPQCCGKPIPLALIVAGISKSEIEKYKSAEVEFLTADRTYCSDTDCGRFIASQHIKGDRATCPKCGHSTCTKCKNDYHFRNDCPADPALQAALTLAKDKGWQRCYACRTVVELRCGCYHVSCKCKAQFCYLCGAKWKTCRCIQDAEDRLYARQEGRDRNNPRDYPPIYDGRHLGAI